MFDLDLTMVWAGIIALAVFAYVVMDGFDLGIGILFPTFAVGEERDQAMNSIAPVWDGNETWLVMGGGGLMAAFPIAYAIILPATYPLVIAMLLGLVFRGVAFEFRWRDPSHRAFWDWAFCIGSIAATFSQGVMLGAILQGIHVEADAYAGGWLDWLSPFSLLTGVALLIGYALLGSTWLFGKVEGSAQQHARRLAKRLALVMLVAIGVVSAVTPFLNLEYARRWLEFPSVLLTAQVPLLTIIAMVLLLRGLRKGQARMPFVMALGLFLLGFIGLLISVFPFVVPGAVTIWQAAVPRESQVFLLAGTAVIIPVIIAYTTWSYWVFRGRVGTEGYH